MERSRRTTFGILTGALVLACAPFGASQANAACQPLNSGYLCARDYEANGYLNVKDSNPSWADFGWEDRADWFQNGGQYCNVAVYSDRNYSGWWVRTLQRGETAEAFFKNTASSNKWCV